MTLEIVDSDYGKRMNLSGLPRPSLDQLREGVTRVLGQTLNFDDAADVLLAEAVRRYLINDKWPPDEDELQDFNFFEICSDIGIKSDRYTVAQIVEELEERDCLASGIYYGEDEVVPKENCWFLSRTGIRHGVLILEKFSGQNFDNKNSKWLNRSLSANQRKELIENIDHALRAMDRLKISNEKKSQGRALLLASRELAEAPEPPLYVIHLLLRHFDRIVGLTGLLIGIASLLLVI